MNATTLDFYVGDLYRSEIAYAVQVADKEVCYRLVSVPQNEGLILGFGTTVSTLIGTVFVAYIAPNRESASTAPAYQSGLSLVVNNRLYRMTDVGITISLVSRLGHRAFSISDHGKDVVTIEYRWPIYREALTRLFGDPFSYKSADIFFEIIQMARVYARGI